MLVRRFSAAARALQLPIIASATPIQPLVLGTASQVLAAQDALLAEGFWVAAIRPPTVARGSARLRVALSAAHTEAQVDALAEALGRICRAPVP
jgi:8-amino-7-oxononanoate synthase